MNGQFIINCLNYLCEVIQLKLMQVNKPDKGLFKGIGPLQKDLHINKKNFPKIRNAHQFQYTHKHNAGYESSFNYFYKTKFLNDSINRSTGGIGSYQKVKKNSNNSQIVFGVDRHQFKSLSQTNYKKYDQVQPTKAFKHHQQGIQFGEDKSINDYYRTTNQQKFIVGPLSKKQNITYRDWRGKQRFNPITGQIKNELKTFGFEDFRMGGDEDRKYKANNFTRIVKGNQRFDIISGRKLTNL